MPMATLTGFKAASAEQTAAQNALTTIARGTSPFQHNVKFTVTGFGYEVPEFDGKVDTKATPSPVLTTSVGSLFLNTLLRGKVNSEHKVVTPNGSFNEFVRKTIAENSSKNNGEILQAIVDGCKDKELIVERIPYAAISKDGRTYAASLVSINFAD